MITVIKNDAAEKEEMLKAYLAQGLTIKDIEYGDFGFFLVERDNWEEQVIVFTKENYDKEEYEDGKIMDAWDIYSYLELDMWSFEKAFQSANILDDCGDKWFLKVNGIEYIVEKL